MNTRDRLNRTSKIPAGSAGRNITLSTADRTELKNNLIKYYDKYADERDSTEKGQWKIGLRDRFLKILKEENASEIIELGCGTGQDSLFFMENGLKVKAVDLSPKHIDNCVSKGIDASVMDIYEMDFEDGVFDGVYTMNCLLHIPKADLINVLNELKRIVKPNGLLYIGNYGGNEEGIRRLEGRKTGRFFSFIEFGEYSRIIKDCGFEIIESEKHNSDTPFIFNYFVLRKKQ